jgi:tRNA(Ile)-lysidine synthase
MSPSPNSVLKHPLDFGKNPNFKGKLSWQNLNHRFLEILKQLRVVDKKTVIAVSGGLDSVVLTDLFAEVLGKKSSQYLALAYVHHGGASEYRSRAQVFCKNLAAKHKVPFYVLGPSQSDLNSENEMRIFRYRELLKLKQKLSFDFVATAHHQNDLLETRLLQLIRGTGQKGLNSLKALNGWKLRPLLGFSKQTLIDYASEQKLDWLEDPSNNNNRFLRNWIRNSWLPSLQNLRPGSIESLARSLEILSTAQNESLGQISPMNVQNYLMLTEPEQRTALSQMIFNAGYKNFSLGLIKEIQKRLDNPKKQHSFQLGPLNWSVNAGLILVFFNPKHNT